MSLIDSLLRGTPPDRWMPLSFLLRKRSLAARLIWRDFTRKWTRELSAYETLSCVDSSLAGKAPEPAARRPPSRAFTKKHTRGLSADEDIMYADHSLGGKIANRSLSTGEIFSSGNSFVFYFFRNFRQDLPDESPAPNNLAVPQGSWVALRFRGHDEDHHELMAHPGEVQGSVGGHNIATLAYIK